VSIGTQQTLQRYAKPVFVSSATSDQDVPFSFRDWFRAYQGIIPGQEYKQYNEYLTEWYKSKSANVIDTKTQLRLNYLSLLRQLQIFFTKEEAENWYNKVDITNDKELLLAIPFFAKKLKDIALYYLQLRNTIKESRLKYNQVGTSSGIIQQIQKFILTNYSQKPDTSITLPASIWKNVPELSAIKDSVTVQIEELYDTKEYFDLSPSVPISAYYNVNDPELLDFLTTKGLLLSSTDWIYRLGVNPLSASYFEYNSEDLTEVSKQIAEKYLSQNKFTSTAPVSSLQTDFYDVGFIVGNNFLYWPSGVYRSKAKNNTRYSPVLINESGLHTNATAGSSLELADTVFVKTTRGIEGAWFRNHLYDYKTLDMSAELPANSTTTFRYPFPGYGLSAEDISWTGFDLKTTPQFFFLTPTLQQNIENVYWSSIIELTASKPLNINDTTLIENRAYSNTDYTRADKIVVWPVTPSYLNSVYPSNDSKETWLYRFNQTDISLSGNSVVVWPYESIDPQGSFPIYYPEKFVDVCSPSPVSAINFTKAVASDALSSADVIYKLLNYKDSFSQAVECCWLSGSPYLHPVTKILGVRQGELQFIANPGNYTRFVWNGPNLTDANTVFKTIKHQPDCKFINTKNTTYLDYKLCTCNQTIFTPFGHPGNNFSDNNEFADFIIENNFDPQKLDLSIWKDTAGTTYTQSSAFGWYKTNLKIGWGDGQWYTGSSNAGNKLYLESGKAYIYFRAAVKKQDKQTVQLPEYVVRYPYGSTNQVWIRAFKNDNDVWVSTSQPSPMVLNPGDILLYQRAQNSFYTLSSIQEETIDVASNRGSIWTNIDYMSINPTNNKSFTLSYPAQNYTDATALNNANPSYPQYPQLNVNDLVTVVQWSVSAPGKPIQYFRDTPSVSIVPTTPGIYTFAVTAMSAANILRGVLNGSYNYNAATQSWSVGNTTLSYTNTAAYIFVNIPPVTAISDKVFVPTLTTFNTPVPGYVLNTPLKGWNYNRGQADLFATPDNAGARPYWARSYTDKNEFTGFKGINSWGTPQRVLNKYNIITQPEISDITLTIGNKIQYTRNFPVNLIWNQPVEFTVTVDRNEWCELEVSTLSSSNLQDQLNNYKNELIVNPTTRTSNIQFQSFVDNEPIEVYYNALNPFTWNITAVPEIPVTTYLAPSTVLGLETEQPWANLSNQTFPTVAAAPSLEELYSISDIGGFFTPSNIGISVYTDKDYTTTLNPSSNSLQEYYNNIENSYLTRGLTKEDQSSPYTNYTQNNIWLKEPTVAGPIAGTIKKSIFKKYQKFLPYQSGYESNPRLKTGLLNPQSRQSPWGGKEGTEWTDIQNKPATFTGIVNVDAWAQSQILKQTGLQIDNWVTDIFGNQYGLYKNISNVPPHDRRNVSGEVWVRKNTQFVQPAYLSLANVFDTYTGTNLINELTGLGIRKIDLFFDTLLVETSGTILFERVNYDYNADNIFSIADEARYLSLAMPVTTNLNKELNNNDLSNFTFAKAGDTWFFPEQKNIVQTVCGLLEFVLTPELYQLDLNNQNFIKIFPTSQEDINSLNALSELNLVTIDPPTLSHNSLKKEYLLTILGKNATNGNVIIEIIIKDLPVKSLKSITVYKPVETTTLVNPPIITQPLRTDVFITNIEFENALNFQCITDNGPAVFEKVSGPEWINLSPTGVFTGTPPFETITYNTVFKVTNSIGPTFYSFITNVYYTEILTIYYLYTEGYILSGGDDFILQESSERIIE